MGRKHRKTPIYAILEANKTSNGDDYEQNIDQLFEEACIPATDQYQPESQKEPYFPLSRKYTTRV